MKEAVKYLPRQWNKQKLIEKIYGKDNTNGIDCAIPQSVADDLHRLGNDNLFFYAYSYKEEDGNASCGKLVNLAEKLYFKQEAELQEATNRIIAESTKRLHAKDVTND